VKQARTEPVTTAADGGGHDDALRPRTPVQTAVNDDNNNDNDDNDDSGPATVDYNRADDSDKSTDRLTQYHVDKSLRGADQQRQTLRSTTDLQHHMKQFTGRLEVLLMQMCLSVRPYLSYRRVHCVESDRLFDSGTRPIKHTHNTQRQ